MRIVQLIDSLDTGGAERMAVNFSNMLRSRFEFSGLVATRKEGSLKAGIGPNVTYSYLEKSGSVDLKAIAKLRAYCKKHGVTHIHAHGTSYFTSVFVKLSLPRIKLVWHVHNGAIASMPKGRLLLLKAMSRLFAGIIVVNGNLEKWVRSALHCPNVIYLPNFVSEPSETPRSAPMKGENRKRVLMVANLREPKNHTLLLESVNAIKDRLDGWTFHLVGKDYADAYSRRIGEFIAREKLADTVYLYGSQDDAGAFIAQSDIAVLSSSSEGLPLALLEYGAHARPVVVTAVGEMPSIVKNETNGFVVSPSDQVGFQAALLRLMGDADLRNRLGGALRDTILGNHSEKAVLNTYHDWLKTL